MQQMYKRIPMLKCDFNTFSYEHLWRAASDLLMRAIYELEWLWVNYSLLEFVTYTNK